MGRVKRGIEALPWYWAGLLALVAGALQTLALAPFNLWPLGLLGLVLFALLLFKAPRRRTVLVALLFGLGLYATGTSWVFVSIHQFGGAPVWLAGLLTGLFVLFMALVFTLPFLLLARLLGHGRLGMMLVFPACYLLGEWLRSWLLTGFPWMYIGYAHLHTPLGGWAPLVGVLGVGYIAAFTAAVAAGWCFLMRPSGNLLMASLLVALCWGGGVKLGAVEWTRVNTEQPISVAMIQPNVPQEVKWNPDYARPTLELLEQLSEPLWGHDWLIWPEAAVPLVYHNARPFLDSIDRRASDTGTGLITGIIYDEPGGHFYNSLAGFGEARGIYHKRRLVPFGEYVPLERWLRGLITFFDLPTSYINVGPEGQRGLMAGEVGIAPSICYEVVYPALVAAGARHANVLLTVSNDAWFADSIGPLQHLQMAQMRALETGRYLVRSTNNGVSAIVDHRGRAVVRSEQFVATTLTGEVYPAYGRTPFMRAGHWPILWLALASVLGVLAARRRFS